jgi:hypothetical protein
MKKQCRICNKITEDYFHIAKSVIWIDLCRDCFINRKKELYIEEEFKDD